ARRPVRDDDEERARASRSRLRAPRHGRVGVQSVTIVHTFVARVLTWWRRRRHRAAGARVHADRERLAARRRATIAAWSSSTSHGSRIWTRPLTRAELEAAPDGE